MADDERKRIEEAKRQKQAEIDRKRAEVRKRLEETAKAKKAKKGFMTPERKKKLRLLLRKKAAEELKKEQERKAAERRRIIDERCGKAKNVDDANEETVKRVLKDYHARINSLEEAKFDLEYAVKKKDFEIADLNSQVNDLRGKFQKPTLKKVSKYENKFAKKGFMTPERKKKLRLLLRKKAAEELKKEQERKAAERKRIIDERCGKPKNVEDANEDTIKRVLKDYHERINSLEDAKFDLEYAVKKKDYEIDDLNSLVNNLPGKFQKPTLKKVSKYENKFAKLQKKAAEFNFRNQLKVVKKKEFSLEEEDKEKSKQPEWSKKGDEKKVGEKEVEA
ncbi:troponin I [Periplaneta americana]|uniref:troponin I n=1 Tax=Periplaneta americana TaxID=6978 RepID=UPI0037E85949